MWHTMEVRAEAAEYFDKGFADRAVAALLDVPRDTVREWLYTYRALGKEALLVSKRKTYPHHVKVEAAQAVVEKGVGKPDVMKMFGIRSMTRLDAWCRLYREGGSDALLPKPKGRPRKTERAFATREEELEARVRELELELEIQKRINALADGIERK